MHYLIKLFALGLVISFVGIFLIVFIIQDFNTSMRYSFAFCSVINIIGLVIYVISNSSTFLKKYSQIKYKRNEKIISEMIYLVTIFSLILSVFAVTASKLIIVIFLIINSIAMFTMFYNFIKILHYKDRF